MHCASCTLIWLHAMPASVLVNEPASTMHKTRAPISFRLFAIWFGKRERDRENERLAKCFSFFFFTFFWFFGFSLWDEGMWDSGGFWRGGFWGVYIGKEYMENMNKILGWYGMGRREIWRRSCWLLSLICKWVNTGRLIFQYSQFSQRIDNQDIEVLLPSEPVFRLHILAIL